MAGVLGLLMVLSGSHVQALGVNAPQTRSNLGQPLDLFFPVNLAPGEALTSECVHADVLAGDTRVPPALVNIVLEGPNEASVRAVRITSLTQINEPIVTVNLSLGCPARMTRQYVALIDPISNAPMADLPAVDTVAQQPASQGYSPALRAALATSESKPEQLLSRPPVSPVATGPAAAASSAASAPHRVAAANAQAQAAGSSDAKPAKTRKRPPRPRQNDTLVASTQLTRAAASAPVSRLRLDAPENPEAKSPLAASAPQNAASEVAAAALAAIAASEVTQSRLAAMEDNINKLQRENKAQMARMLELQTQLNAAQSGGNAGTLTWMLGLMALGLGAFSVYQWRVRQQREEWWATESARRPARPDTPITRKATPDEPASTLQIAPHTAPIPIVDAPVSDLDQFMAAPSGPSLSPDTVTFHAETQPIPFMESQLPPSEVRMGHPPADGLPVTVEELLDMEQQVEFFLVLGQTDAAISLLNSRVDTGTSSALPYLKLLEIHQMHGDVAAFTELAQRFAQRFKALPPAWGGMTGDGLGLETAAAALRQVQAVWMDPAASMELLQKLLIHGEEGSAGPEAFDLPTYRDLLLLYSVARDLSEHDVRGADIDLFLPLDVNSTSMMATMPMQRPGAPVPMGGVVVDISLDPMDPRT